MAMMNCNYSPVLAPYLGRRAALRGAPLLFFDVGVSGGVHPLWEAFGEDLRVWGFDPQVREIERLQALGRPGHTYVCAFVGYLPYRARHAPADWWQPGARNNQPWSRTAPAWAMALPGVDGTREAPNDKKVEVTLTERMVSIDHYCAQAGIADLDFLKIDTDGADYEVLLGAEHMLSVGGILGIQVEAQFHGAVDREASLFSTIDLFLRERGFSLFDLDLWRCARAVLPRPCVYDLPAPTRRGQINWADALYLRDLGDPDYEQKWAGLNPAARLSKVLKLAALFDLFNLQDCAVELLQKYAAVLKHPVNVDEMIAAMLPTVAGQPVTYDQFLAHCRELFRQKRYRDIPM